MISLEAHLLLNIILRGRKGTTILIQILTILTVLLLVPVFRKNNFNLFVVTCGPTDVICTMQNKGLSCWEIPNFLVLVGSLHFSSVEIIYYQPYIWAYNYKYKLRFIHRYNEHEHLPCINFAYVIIYMYIS